MGNSVSAHIYETEVFRPYPVILYRLRLDPSIHWWEKIGVPRNDQTYSVVRQLYYICMAKAPFKINGK